jgi:hypothetical protein
MKVESIRMANRKNVGTYGPECIAEEPEKPSPSYITVQHVQASPSS